MKLLLQTADTLLVEMDGRVELLPNNDYTALRVVKFGGERISHDFGDGCVIQETYNRGVYNCECGGESIQVYDGGLLARAILDDDGESYREIFAEWHGAKLQEHAVDAATGPYGDRVRRDGDKYLVDDDWAVDQNGWAFYRHDDGEWRGLCLVANRTVDRMVVLPGHEKPVTVNGKTWIVIAKILFLLFPVPEPVFMRQLPERLRQSVRSAYVQAGAA